jgi:hypothetical protein
MISGDLSDPPRALTISRADGISAIIYTHVLNRGGKGVVSPSDMEDD